MAKSKIPRSLRGMKDILPDEQTEWFFIEDTFRRVVSSFGFERIIVPVLEETALFVRGVGPLTDLISKELYSFKDKGGERVSLRPEFTAGVVRAYIQNGMQTWPKPVKLWSWGPVFRHDRPQAGRLREFYQYNLEALGEEDAAMDVQLIWLLNRFYRALGLNIAFHLNTLGASSSRSKLIKAIRHGLRLKRRKLCADCQTRLKSNPLRVLDCKIETCQPFLDEVAPTLIDLIDEPSRKHFAEVLELLDELGVPYELNPRLVRGLDYYTRTTFEVFEAGVLPREGLSLGGGGRYDLLIKQLGGPATPAIGFAGGAERLVEALVRNKIKAPIARQIDLFIVQIGKLSKTKAFNLMRQLEEAGFSVGNALGKGSLKAQLRSANRAGSLFALIVGDQEVHDGTVILRDMQDHSQEVVVDRNLLKRLKLKSAEKRVTP